MTIQASVTLYDSPDEIIIRIEDSTQAEKLSKRGLLIKIIQNMTKVIFYRLLLI
jgi:hypothetical protein